MRPSTLLWLSLSAVALGGLYLALRSDGTPLDCAEALRVLGSEDREAVLAVVRELWPASGQPGAAPATWDELVQRAATLPPTVKGALCRAALELEQRRA